jgi:osmotically-inducible protein OsmY
MSLTGGVRGLTDDREIEQDVRAELEVDQGATGQRFVGVAVDRGVVRLTGSADSYAQKWAIGRAAGRVVGVKEVRDHLDVRPPEDVHREDRQIERAARRALEWDARVPDGVGAEVTDGVLRLHGTVARFPQRDAAEEAVRNLVGVRDVVNEIRVAPVPPLAQPADLALGVGAAIRRRFGAGSGYLSIAAADGVVTLSGVVPTFAMLDDIERAVRSIPGVTRIDNRLLVA